MSADDTAAVATTAHVDDSAAVQPPAPLRNAGNADSMINDLKTLFGAAGGKALMSYGITRRFQLVWIQYYMDLRWG